MSKSTIPKALFSCSNDYCMEEISYAAGRLFLFEPEQRWICDSCWDELPCDESGEHPERGISLHDFILQNKITAAQLLHDDYKP